jgi:hypothetical protein
MDTSIILTKYWAEFLKHICAFYPLEKSFIAQWEYELDWRSISKNRAFDWNDDFIDQYQERLIWHELAWNESIIWDIPKIEKFKKRLDWYYLQQNEVLPLSEAFIDKYRKKIKQVADSNPNLTEALIEKYDLKAYPNRKNSTDLHEPIPEDALPAYLDEVRKDQVEPVLYQTVFLPVEKEIGLDVIFNTKFDYSQRYYSLEAKEHDIHGLTPEFEPANESDKLDKFIDGPLLEQLTKELVLKNGSLQEGPDRLLEIIRTNVYISRMYMAYSTLLVSENVKAVLEKFNLPQHTFRPVIMKHRKIKSDTKYYILQIAADTLLKDLDFENTNFTYRTTYNRNEPEINERLGHKLNDHAHLLKMETELKEKFDRHVEVRPDVFHLCNALDMYSYDRKVIINDFLKQALEKAFPNQMYFKSAQGLPIKIDQFTYDSKAVPDLAETVKSKTIYIPSEADLFFQAKMQRLESSGKTVTPEMTQDDAFRAKELELDVLFPESFKDKVLSKRLKIRGYKMLKPERYYIDNEYTGRNPETYKSVVIAENGHGDSINLLLEKDSDYLLSDTYYEFLHETGQVEYLGAFRYKA